MFEPLIKNLVRKLDVAAVAYLERQQLINLMAVPGTLLFLLLFWAFSGAGGLMLVLGLFVVAQMFRSGRVATLEPGPRSPE